MLIFISDLHFVDGSAGKHNVPSDAFEIFLEDIAATCDWLNKKHQRTIEEIKLVFLGDIFDLLRTEMWFNYPITDRPWGKDEAKIEQNANTIFDAIIKENKKTFDLLKGDLKDTFKLPVEPERVYIPGNHDRLCNKYASLRKKVRKCLGIVPLADAAFDHTLEDIDHGVFARHGHEYDKFNYEGGISYTHDDYMRMPIGDPITTELVSKIPWALMKRREVKALPAQQRNALKRNFQEIDNVRPFSAITEWLLYQVKKNLSLKEVIEDVVDGVVKEFNNLEFTKQWYKHHDKWTDFWDEADQIQSVLFLLEKFKIFPSEKLIPFVERVRERFQKDDLLEAAPMEYSQLDNRIRYVVYGHTHTPLQVPLRITPVDSKEQVYLNTGTWRARHLKSKEGLSFIAWKNMTYLIFYKKEERGMDFPTFETWTGTLKTI